MGRAVFVHSLLHDRPIAFGREDERVQIDLKTVGDSVVVYAGGQAADPDQRVAVETVSIGERTQFVRSVARVFAATRRR